jgi:peptidoglycan/LPS O-acetylase OafA/YrhL
MESQQPNGKRVEIKSHTDLRGLAAFLLMFYHTNPWRYIPFRPVNTFLNHGLLRR